MPSRPSLANPWCVAAFAVSLLSSTGVSAAADTTYYGVYMNGRKIGWMRYVAEDIASPEGKRIRLTTDGVLTIELMGTSVRQESTIVSMCDEKLRPLTQEYAITSNGSTMRLRATYRQRQVDVEITSGGSPLRRTLTVPGDGVLSADSSFLTLGADPLIGSKLVVYYLNPLTINLDRATITVEARERVTYAGEAFDAVRTLAVTPLGRIRTWESPPGQVLWGELPLGMAMFRMPESDALSAAAREPTHMSSSPTTSADLKPPADFALATAVTTDRPIVEPRKLRSLTLEVSGIGSPSLAITDNRQTVTPVPGKAGTYRIAIQVPSQTPDRRLPIRSASLARFAGRAPYLDIDNGRIRQLAASLRDPKSARRTASRIRNWVHRNLVPDFSIGVPRSSVDVLQRKRGVCRDYAVLAAALARAAGIPARLVGGVVYADGRFYYHAWIECWMGDWVAYDATLPTDLVDATHVKFAHGDPTDMMRVYEVIGKLQVRVISSGR